MKKIKIVIVDDHKMFREGLKFLLSEMENVKVIGDAENGEIFIKLLHNLTPDIVLMDLNMPVMDGIEATIEAIKIIPNIKIIALTMFGDEDYYYKMIHAGAVGFILKKSGSNELSEAIESVMKGDNYFSQELLKNIILTIGNRKKIRNEKGIITEFTKREQEVFELICEGMSAKEIANKLYISFRTVNGHKQNLFEKTGINNTTGLIMFGIKNNLIKD